METQLLSAINAFVAEIRRVQTKRPGTGISLALTVKSDRYGSHDDPPKIELSASVDYQTVKASSLGRLMDEVMRRLGFEDREALRVDELEKGLVALPNPFVDITREDL